MKILGIAAETNDKSERIKGIGFSPDVTLLVGLSGSGKTRALDVLKFSLALATETVKLQPIQARLRFELDGKVCSWSYTIDTYPESYANAVGLPRGHYVRYEHFEVNGCILIDKTPMHLYVNGEMVPESPHYCNRSVLYRFHKENECMDRFVECAKELVAWDRDFFGGWVREGLVVPERTKLGGCDEYVYESFKDAPLTGKLYLAQRYRYKEVYEPVLNSMREVFPAVECIHTEVVPMTEARNSYCLASVQINGQRISVENLSHGMQKALCFLMDLYTVPAGTMIVVDEFENGLDAACIGTLTKIVTTVRPDVQIIMSSHHPQVMRGVCTEKWRILSREGVCMTAKSYSQCCTGDVEDAGDVYSQLLRYWGLEG